MSWVRLCDAAANTGHTLDEPVTVEVIDESDPFFQLVEPTGQQQLAAMRALGSTRITVADFISRWPDWSMPEWSYRGRHKDGTPAHEWSCWDMVDVRDKIETVSWITLRYYTPDGPELPRGEWKNQPTP